MLLPSFDLDRSSPAGPVHHRAELLLQRQQLGLLLLVDLEQLRREVLLLAVGLGLQVDAGPTMLSTYSANCMSYRLFGYSLSISAKSPLRSSYFGIRPMGVSMALHLAVHVPLQPAQPHPHVLLLAQQPLPSLPRLAWVRK